jgi:hypothetical protein
MSLQAVDAPRVRGDAEDGLMLSNGEKSAMPEDAVHCPYTMRAHLIRAAYLAVHDQRTRDQFITLARAFYDIMVDASAEEREATLKLVEGGR